MIHPSTELRFISEGIGYGVVAKVPIPKGTITWVQDELDQRLTNEQVERLRAPLRAVIDRYAYVDGSGEWILCWDHARYMNHSCAPTTLSPGYNFDIAIRDIAAGEEISCDYGGLNLKHAFRCLCGAKTCRGVIDTADLLALAEDHDRLLQDAFRVLDGVEQPLWHLLRPEERMRVEAAAGDPERLMESTLRHYYAGEAAASERGGRRASKLAIEPSSMAG